MINPAWLFVSATVIAVFGILFSFKNLMGKVQSKLEVEKELKMELIQKEQTSFFIKVAIAESIPILLIVYGFMQIDQLNGRTINIFLPLIIIIAVHLFALFNTFMIRRDTLGFGETTTDVKNNVNTLIFIGIALMSAIPIISVVALFTMVG